MAGRDIVVSVASVVNLLNNRVVSWRFNYGEGMDDRETVAAIVAGDLAGLADAYDRYAESLYGYSHWMLPEPADADDAILDTFVIAAGGLGGLRDPRKCARGCTLRPATNAIVGSAGRK